MTKDIKRTLKLAEESGEIVQASMKHLIHGADGKNPHIEDSPTNKENLENEIGDLIAIIDLILEAGQLDSARISKQRFAKREKLIGLGYRGQEEIQIGNENK